MSAIICSAVQYQVAAAIAPMLPPLDGTSGSGGANAAADQEPFLDSSSSICSGWKAEVEDFNKNLADCKESTPQFQQVLGLQSSAP